MTRPLLILIPLIAGISAGYVGAPLYLSLATIGIGLCIYLLTMFYSRDALRATIHINRMTAVHPIWVILLSFGSGVLIEHFARPDTPLQMPAEGSVITAEIVDRSNRSDYNTYHLNIKSVADSLGNNPIPYRRFPILLYTQQDLGQLGDVIAFKANMSPLDDDTDRFENDYVRQMHGKGYRYIQVDYSPKNFVLIGHHNSLERFAYSSRRPIELRLEESNLNADVRDFIITILLADRAFLNTDTQRRFSAIGLSHMLAVSGLHIGIITSIILLILLPLNLICNYKYRYFIAIIAIWIYTIATGLAPSTTRAACMVTFMFGALMLERPYAAANGLLWSTVFILIFSPYTIMDVGFQLSFACVASLIAFAPKCNFVSQRQHARLYRINEAIIVCLVSTFGSWSLTSFYFKQIPLLFLPANLIILPLLPFYIGVAILYVILLMCGIDFAVLTYILDWGYAAMQWLTTNLANIGWVISLQVNILTTAAWTAEIIILAWLLDYYNTHRVINGIHYTKVQTPTQQRVRTCAFTGIIIAMTATVATAPLFASEQKPDDYIIQQKSDVVSVAVRTAGKDTTFSFPRRSVSSLVCCRDTLICVDTDSLPSSRLPSGKYIIASGYTGRMENIKKRIPANSSLIFHKSLHYKRAKRFIKEADELNIPYHDLRSGPYRKSKCSSH